ncbi:hypothetical protein C8J57DRAFT_1250588 [Mycena rebaudengoi]|nr:hypothetical protein C8J57DRAFT_1250588 [Mycena rebaudengoi]
MGGENKGQSPGGKKHKDRCKEELGSYDEWKKTRRARRGMGQKRRNLKDGKIKYENAMGKRGVRGLAMDMRYGKGSGGEWKGKESTGKRRDRRKIGTRDRGDGIASGLLRFSPSKDSSPRYFRSAQAAEGGMAGVCDGVLVDGSQEKGTYLVDGWTEEAQSITATGRESDPLRSPAGPNSPVIRLGFKKAISIRKFTF